MELLQGESVAARLGREGRHGAEAHQVLTTAEPRLAALRDEFAWKAANADGCKDPVESTACLTVEDYLAKYPEGPMPTRRVGS